MILFPLQTGVGLVSYDVSENDTLDFREVYVVTENLRQCAFMYLVLETATKHRGYCLGTAQSDSVVSLYSQIVDVRHSNLSLSSVSDPQGPVRVQVHLESLSNLVYFENPGDRCFVQQGGHVVLMERGYLVDHIFSNHNFNNAFYEVDSSCVSSSRLRRTRGTCYVAAYCRGMWTIVNTKQLSSDFFSEVEYGQVFVCPNREFLGFMNDTLSVYATDRSLSRNVSFPIGQDIRRGDCAIVNDKLVFVATLNDGRTFLFEFGSSDAMSYRQIGESDQSATSTTVVDGVVFVNNGNESLAYDVRSRCVQAPISTPHNFILANVFTTSSTALCRCPAFPNPTSTSVTPSSTLEVEMESSSSVLLPVSSPMPTSSTVMNPPDSKVQLLPILVPVCMIIITVVAAVPIITVLAVWISRW